MSTLSAAILVANKNHSSFLEDLLRSIRGQTVAPANFVVVDDHSTDSSMTYLLQQDDVMAIKSRKSGQAAAWATGLSVIDEDVTLLLDADDTCRIDRVENVLELYRRYPTAQWMFHNVRQTRTPCATSTNESSDSTRETLWIDERQSLRLRGRPVLNGPATSGLTFRTSFLRRLLPTQNSEGVTVSDNFLKFGALGLAPGLYSSDHLSFLRLHDSNSYTGTRNLGLKRSIALATAHELLRVDASAFSRIAHLLRRGAYFGSPEELSTLGMELHFALQNELELGKRLSWTCRGMARRVLSTWRTAE
jgi:Glycosyl transferase family 2